MAVRAGWDAVGLWQSVTRISDAYMQIFGVVFMNYFLPQLAATPATNRPRRLMSFGVLISVMFFSGITVLYFLREPILTLAFSRAFSSAAIHVPAQAVGDAFKLGSLVFVYYLMAQNRASVQAGLEVLQAALTAVAYVLLVPSMGALAPVASYAAATLVVLAATLVLVVRNGRATCEGSGPAGLPPATGWADGQAN